MLTSKMGKIGLLLLTQYIAVNAVSSPPQPTQPPRQNLVGGPLWTAADTRFVELGLVADHSFFLKHGARTHDRCRAIVNIVNAVFRRLGVAVVLRYLEVWEERDRITVEEDAQVTLNHLRPYRKQLLEQRPDLPQDTTILLTAVNFKGTTAGYASVGGICSVGGGVGVAADSYAEAGVVALTVAHELGHNLGMYHDHDQCHCHTHSCLMNATDGFQYNPASIAWSSCSRQKLLEGVKSLSFDCLRNVPTQVWSGDCGDGVVGEGEECDCGPPELCNNPCCHASTCTLAANATCASGACCDTEKCQMWAAGTECRSARNDCDLPEFCTGDSEFCPEDVSKGDGAVCGAEQAEGGHCYHGVCGSHEGRCRAVLGARAAPTACYSQWNPRGGSSGNCGLLHDSDLSPCSPADVLCGTLHCHLPESVTLNRTSNLPGAIPVTMSSGNTSCTLLLAAGTNPALWLTPDGAACSPGKMCVNQRCVSVDSGGGDCEGGCSGRGVCNSRGHCHCDPGFAPPHCSQRGNGGSIDSGPATYPQILNPFVEGLLITLFIAVALIVVLLCLWGKLRAWRQGGGCSSVTRVLPCCASCLDSCLCPSVTTALDFVLSSGILPEEGDHSLEETVQVNEDQQGLLFQVVLDFPDLLQPQYRSWGIASDRLVTETVTVTPKNTSQPSWSVYLPSSSTNTTFSANSDSCRTPHPNHAAHGVPTQTTIRVTGAQRVLLGSDSLCVDAPKDNLKQQQTRPTSVNYIHPAVPHATNNTLSRPTFPPDRLLPSNSAPPPPTH